MGTPCKLLGNTLNQAQDPTKPSLITPELAPLAHLGICFVSKSRGLPKTPPVNLLTPQLGPDCWEHLKCGGKDLAALGAVGLGRLPDIPAPNNPPLRREVAPAEELQPMQGLNLAQCEEITGVI